MAAVSIYLNFMGKTEEAFKFYRSVFGTEFSAPIQYMRDVPSDPNQKPLAENEKNCVMHVDLPILAGIHLMGTDMLESMGHSLTLGNNMSINLQPDTLDETKRLCDALFERGSIEMPLQKMFWGDYFASGVDAFGTRWMLNCSEQA